MIQLAALEHRRSRFHFYVLEAILKITQYKTVSKALNGGAMQDLCDVHAGMRHFRHHDRIVKGRRMQDNQIISEDTLTTWIIFSALSAIVFIAAANFFLYLIYDCWPLRSVQSGGVNCFSNNLPSWLYLLPAIIGSVTGTYLTKLHLHKSADRSKG